MSDEGLGEQEDPSTIHHDDIVKRLLEYQRRLREGASPAEAARLAAPEPPLIDYAALDEQQAVATEEVVDLRAAEAEATAEAEAGAEIAVGTGPVAADGVVTIPEARETGQPDLLQAPEAEAPAVEGDLAERIIALERTLSDLAKDLRELRTQSQDYALVVDDRLAAIQAKLDEATGRSASES
jgi:hypothetical protein